MFRNRFAQLPRYCVPATSNMFLKGTVGARLDLRTFPQNWQLLAKFVLFRQNSVRSYYGHRHLGANKEPDHFDSFWAQAPSPINVGRESRRYLQWTESRPSGVQPYRNLGKLRYCTTLEFLCIGPRSQARISQKGSMFLAVPFCG